MVHNDEDNFPRGSKKVETTAKRKNKSYCLFAAQKSKKQKKEPPGEPAHDTYKASLNHARILSRKTLHEGMVVLACIKKITNQSLELQLPGLLSAKVTINAISDNLNVILENALRSSEISSVSKILKTLFAIGGYVPFKVTSFENKDEKLEIFGSISPSDIYLGRRHDSFNKGELLWAEVVSESDHGYQLNCGIGNCRIFLPNENIDRELKIGQLLWCKIHKIDKEKTASTVRVGARKQHIDTVFINGTTPLNLIIPGTKVQIQVEEMLKHGLHCKFLNNYVGFIHESHLDAKMRKGSSELQKLNAYVLYVEETTKISFLTFNNLEPNVEQNYSRGDKVSATVIGIGLGGLYLKLNKNEKGWVSNRRLISALGKSANYKKSIKDKFPVGSQHQCVVLNYFLLDRIYVCGIEKELINAKYFNVQDFSMAEVVQGMVHEIKSNGIVLSVGQVKGFIPNIHLTDAPYSDNLKKKFTIGKKITAKVFSITEENVTFTLKTKFVKDDRCLSSMSQAKTKEFYPALVLSAKLFGLVLSFYNNIDGFVPVQELNIQNVQEYRDNPTAFFHSGEVINVRISKITPKKIICSLKVAQEKPKMQSDHVGEIVEAIVTKIDDKGLNVSVTKLKIKGFVPKEHLSLNLSLCPAMLGTFKENDTISDLMIIKSNETSLILSRREALAYKRCGMQVPNFGNIRKGCLVRCSVESVSSNGVVVSTPIKDWNKTVFVETKWISENEKMPNLSPQQSVLGRIINIDQDKKSLQLSLKLEDVFDNNIEDAVGFFTSYLADVAYIRNSGRKIDCPLNAYEIGNSVMCSVKKVETLGCRLELPNGCPGLVVSSLLGYPHPSEGDKLRGTVLGINYKLNYVQISLDKHINKHINPVQGERLPTAVSEMTVQTLLEQDQYILALSRKAANKQLVYVPLRLCENDFDLSSKDIYQKEAFKVNIHGQYDRKLICFHKRINFSLKRKPEYRMETIEGDYLSSDQTRIGGDGNRVSKHVEAHSSTAKRQRTSKKQKKNIAQCNDVTEEGTTCSDVGIPCSAKSEEIPNGNVHAPILPSISDFFTAEFNNNELDNSSTDNEDDVESGVLKKRKMTPAERTNQEKIAEQALSEIEKMLADPTREPQTVTDFERHLLAEPNSSALWIKYMSFYLATAEFDKARTVGRRGLETINMTLENEKFNVWIALLNLENLYGTKESFDESFEQALKYNDNFKLYMKVIDGLHESGKLFELEEKIKKVRAKFKHLPEMWIRISKLYYLLGKVDEAREIKNACFKSITNMKQQFALIIKFALLEFSYGDSEIGISIFENILETYPSKEKSWSVYVNQLISKNRITDARNLFQRAISAQLPLKVSRRILVDYKSFEEKYGNAESLELYKVKAKESLLNRGQI